MDNSHRFEAEVEVKVTSLLDQATKIDLAVFQGPKVSAEKSVLTWKNTNISKDSALGSDATMTQLPELVAVFPELRLSKAAQASMRSLTKGYPEINVAERAQITFLDGQSPRTTGKGKLFYCSTLEGDVARVQILMSCRDEMIRHGHMLLQLKLSPQAAIEMHDFLRDLNSEQLSQFISKLISKSPVSQAVEITVHHNIESAGVSYEEGQKISCVYPQMELIGVKSYPQDEVKPPTGMAWIKSLVGG